MKTIDPNIIELRAFIREKWAALMDEETLNTDGEIAIYWFASEYYSGQWSNLYSAMCVTGYDPGHMINDVTDENESVCMIFNSLIEKYDPENGEQVFNEETGEFY